MIKPRQFSTSLIGWKKGLHPKKPCSVMERNRRVFFFPEGRSTSSDHDTLREVPHPSNEGLALQARVSGPWLHKKESVLLVYLARWHC